MPQAPPFTGEATLEDGRRRRGATHGLPPTPFSIPFPKACPYLLSSFTETTSPPSREEKKEMEKLWSWYTATSMGDWYTPVLMAAGNGGGEERA